MPSRRGRAGASCDRWKRRSSNLPTGLTPLWSAGHLPLKGGEWQLMRRGQPISLLEGEMAGRPEGGISGRKS